MKRIIILLTAVVCMFAACRSGVNNSEKTANSVAVGKKISLHYSSLLRMYECDGYTKVELRNPADTSEVSRTYIMVEGNTNLDSIPSGIVLKIPLQNTLVCTSLHAGLLKTIGALQQIGGVCDAKYIVDSVIRANIIANKIVDCGYTANPDRERILSLAPDAVLLSPYDGMQTISFFDAANIPVVDCVDYLENTPLGQAEWIKFYGILMGHKHETDSIFDVVVRNYTELTSQIAKIDNRPSLLAEKMYQQTWFVPTGKSTSGVFYKDAGFSYVFDTQSNNDGRVSVPLTFEQVYATAHDADFWIFKYYGEHQSLTLELLAAENPQYKDFKAYKQHKIYACNTWKTPYYDETPFRPDILLRELVGISHPDIIKDFVPQYFYPLE